MRNYKTTKSLNQVKIALHQAYAVRLQHSQALGVPASRIKVPFLEYEKNHLSLFLHPYPDVYLGRRRDPARTSAASDNF